MIQGCVQIDLYNFDNFMSHQLCTKRSKVHDIFSLGIRVALLTYAMNEVDIDCLM